MKTRNTEQADAKGKLSRGGYHRWLKRHKVRIERQRAKQDPECSPCYRKFSGYEM
jgi:hypothetical protein